MISFLPIKIIECIASNEFFIQKFRTAAKIALANKIDNVPISSYYSSSEHPNAGYFRKKLPLHLKFPEKVTKANIFGFNYYEYLNNAKVVLNIHRSELHDYGNIRCFEATGMGALLMTNRVEAMHEYFLNDTEFLGFENNEEFVERFKSIINNLEKLEMIAEDGMTKTLNNFTSDNQAKRMVNAINEKNNIIRPY